MIRQRIDGDIWTVTLDRPDKANALTREMLVNLAEIVEKAASAKVLVLTGNGSVFSAGADLEAARAGLTVDPVWDRLSAAIAGLPGLTIAALNGTVAGGALGMVLACDLRIAVPRTKIFYPVMKLGFLPRPPDPARLVALVGPARAKMILMAGQKIETEEALRWGLIDRVTDDLSQTVAELTTDVATASSDHVAQIKQMIA